MENKSRNILVEPMESLDDSESLAMLLYKSKKDSITFEAHGMDFSHSYLICYLGLSQPVDL